MDVDDLCLLAIFFQNMTDFEFLKITIVENQKFMKWNEQKIITTMNDVSFQRKIEINSIFEKFGKKSNSMNFGFIKNNEKYFICCAPQNNFSSKTTPLSKKENKRIYQKILSLLDSPDLLDFDKIVGQSFKDAQELIEEIQKKTQNLFDPNKIAKLKLCKIHVEKDESMNNEKFEWNFCGSSNGEIYYPDIKNFRAKHKDFWIQLTDAPKRFYQDYFYRSKFVMFHEIIHCFQGHLWKFGLTLWKAEFAASINHLNLFYLSCKKNNKLGKFWEIYLWMNSIVNKIEKEYLSKENKKKYKDWNNSFGFKDPFSKNEEIKSHLNSYFKLKLPLDNFDERKCSERVSNFFKIFWEKDLNKRTTYLSCKDEKELIQLFKG